MPSKKTTAALVALGTLVGGVAVLQIVERNYEEAERERLYNIALYLATKANKPMLVVGVPYASNYPCSPDVTLDISPVVLEQCPIGGIVADVRSIPYSDKEFGATFISHVLEHLRCLEEVQQAWRELWRVSDTVLVAYPKPTNPYANLNPRHHLWVEPYSPYLWIDEWDYPHRHALIAPDGMATLFEPI